MSNELLDRIVVNPDVAGGKATIRGHRIWVSLVLGLLADGMSVNEVLAEYPGLEEADVRACIAYGARALEAKGPRQGPARPPATRQTFAGGRCDQALAKHPCPAP